MSRILPPDSVRGRIRKYIERQAPALGTKVLEIGSRLPSTACWWANNRDLAVGDWLGVDMQDGKNVDEVVDVHRLPDGWSDRFSGVLCSEVLEHVENPKQALQEMLRVLKPQGLLIVTTLTAFPIHGYPNDYRRWTEAGLALELTMAGFDAVKTEAAGRVDFMLNDHGEAGVTRLSCPMHVFATAQKC